MGGMLLEPSVSTKTLYLYKTVLAGLIGHRAKRFSVLFSGSDGPRTLCARHDAIASK
jgi:hypothetical protein